MKPIKEITINSFNSLLDAINVIRAVYGDGRYLEIKVYEATRTNQQNKSLHKWFRMVSQELESQGIDKRDFFKEGYFRKWTEEDVKSDIFKPVQKALGHGDKTSELGRSEIDKVIDPIMLKLADCGIVVPFPSDKG